ncbi:MAG: Yip1 family protein, partial [Caulobacteraceae bacterium]
MTVVDGGPGGGGLVARIKNILLTPKTEWDVIDAELAAIGGLYTKYVCILAAIPAVAGLIGAQLFGIGLPGIATYKPPLVGSVVTALVTYLLSLAAVYVLALIIDALAPSFNGTKNQTQAFKVAAYSYTAAWVAGVFNILPALSILVILGSLYGLYLLYLGLPKLMKAPAEKAISYTVVVVVAAFVVSLVIGMIVGSISAAAIGMSGLNRIAANTAATGGVLSV